MSQNCKKVLSSIPSSENMNGTFISDLSSSAIGDLNKGFRSISVYSFSALRSLMAAMASNPPRSPSPPSSPVFEIARNVVIPKIGQINVHPNPEYGEPTSWADAVSFEEAVSSGAVHPLDAKMAIASGLSQVLEPIKKHFAENDELLHAIVAISGGN